MTLQFGWWDHFEQRADMPLWQQYDERIDLILRAEEHGFYGYHIAEHHFTTLDMAPSPIVFLAAVARRTSKIRLGTMVLCLPLYHPTRLIQEICMIDQLSHGRFMPGVGRGIRDVEHEFFGGDIHQTRDAYDEVLSVLLQGLRTGRITHHGKRFQYDDVPVHFEMVQKPYPRFWYTGESAAGGRTGNERPRQGITRTGGAVLADLAGGARATGSSLPRRGTAGRVHAPRRARRQRCGRVGTRAPRIPGLCGALPCDRGADRGRGAEERRIAAAGRGQFRRRWSKPGRCWPARHPRCATGCGTSCQRSGRGTTTCAARSSGAILPPRRPGARLTCSLRK